MPSPNDPSLEDLLETPSAPGLFDPAVRRDTLTLGAVALGAALFSIAFADVPIANSVRVMPDAIRGLANTLTHLGKLEYMLVAAALFAGIAAWLGRRAWVRWTLFLLAAQLAAGAVIHLFKFVIGRPRPGMGFGDAMYAPSPFTPGSDFASMPSGHSATIACLAAVLWLRFPRLWPAWIAVAAVISLTRVFTLSHYLSDVFIGLWIGAAATLLVHVPMTNAGLLPAPSLKRPG
ncbi:MAG: phosphatase PAP2 family protein [Planctomycetota bacterium]